MSVPLQLRVAINDARDLKVPFGFKTDVYVVLTSAGHMAQSNITKSMDGLAIWDELFEFMLTPDWQQSQQITIQVYHRGVMNDSPIGQVIIPIHYLTDKVGQRDCRYHQLTKVTDFSKPAGEIKAELAVVQANFDPYQQQPQQQQQQMVDPYGFPVSPGFDFAQAHMQQPQQPQHSRQHSRQPPPPSQQQPVTLNRGDMLDGKYRVERLLGKGNFGTAYLATSEVDDQQYAVKLILCKRDSDLSTIKSEAKILFRMLHDNIVRYFSSFIHIDHLGQKYFGMVMEFCENQDIQCHINRYKKHHLHISDRRIVRWTLEIAEVRFTHGIR